MQARIRVSRGTRVRDNVRWTLFVPSLVLVVAGLCVLLLDIATETKHFLAGMLVGVGAGAALAEIAAAYERRDMRGEIAQLREPLLGDCRLAYRIGEFSFACFAAISRGERGDRHVEEMLVLSESLGVGNAVKRIVDTADPSSPTLRDDLNERLRTALHFKGQSVPVFFRLGSDMVAVRGADAKSNPDARAIVAKRIGENLAIAERVIGDGEISAAWRRVVELWARDLLSADEIDELLLAFHVNLLIVGSENDGYLTWKALVGDLAGLKDGSLHRPKRLDSILGEINKALGPETARS